MFRPKSPGFEATLETARVLGYHNFSIGITYLPSGIREAKECRHTVSALACRHPEYEGQLRYWAADGPE